MSEKEQQTSAGRHVSLRVIKFTRKDCPFSNLEKTWQQFHTFRNGVLDILLKYGSIGPSGKIPILDSYDESYEQSSGGTSKPDFFVVDDDIYGRSVRVEASWKLAKPPLFEELAMFLAEWRDWCVYFALIKGGLFVFHDLMLYEGAFFEGCASVEAVFERCAQATEPDAPSAEESLLAIKEKAVLRAVQRGKKPS
jgi:hypothetical protein